jgi:hypothetical protein
MFGAMVLNGWALVAAMVPMQCRRSMVGSMLDARHQQLRHRNNGNSPQE